MPSFVCRECLTGDSRNSEEEVQTLEESVMARISAADRRAESMRAAEGKSLAEELRKGLDRLSGFVDEVAEMRHDVQKVYFERVSQRLSELLNGNLDKDRVLQEAAMLAERSDVEEEIARMRTHIAHLFSDRSGWRDRQEARFPAAGDEPRGQHAAFKNRAGSRVMERALPNWAGHESRD